MFDGDPRIERELLEVLRLAPAPIAHRIVTTCVIVGVAIDSLGWIDGYPDPPCDDATRVVLGCMARGIICHELSHAWHRSPRSPRSPRCRRERLRDAERMRVDMARAAVANDDVGWLVDLELEPETMADRVASLWLGEVVNTCGARRNAEIIANIQRRAAATGNEGSDT